MRFNDFEFPSFPKSKLYEGFDNPSKHTAFLWESAGKKITEAQLTADQINQLFGAIETQITAGGTNRTVLGKGKDALTAVNRAWNDLKTKIQNSGPVTNFDQKISDVLSKIGMGSADPQFNGQVAGWVQKYRNFAKQHPIMQGAVYATLIALAGISGAGVGGAAALGLLRAADQLLQGQRASSAAYGGAKAGALAYGAGQLLGPGNAQVAEPTQTAVPDQAASAEVPQTDPTTVAQPDATTAATAAPEPAADTSRRVTPGGTTGITPDPNAAPYVSHNAAPAGPSNIDLLKNAGVEVPKGAELNADYLQKAADPNRVGKFLISPDDAQKALDFQQTVPELVQNIQSDAASSAASATQSMAEPAADTSRRVTPGGTTGITPDPNAAPYVSPNAAPAGPSNIDLLKNAGVEVPKGAELNADYLQKAADPNRVGRYMISVDDAKAALEFQKTIPDQVQNIQAQSGQAPFADPDYAATARDDAGNLNPGYAVDSSGRLRQNATNIIDPDTAGQAATTTAQANVDATDQVAGTGNQVTAGKIDYTQPGQVTTDSIGQKLEYGVPVNDAGGFMAPSEELQKANPEEYAQQKAAYDAWKQDFTSRNPDAKFNDDGSVAQELKFTSGKQKLNGPWNTDPNYQGPRPKSAGESRRLNVAQINQLFEQLEQIVLTEGVLDDIKKYAGSAMNYLKTKGHNLTTKVTADKLSKAWQKAGSPTDHNQLVTFLQTFGINNTVIKKALATIGINSNTQAAPTVATVSSAAQNPAAQPVAQPAAQPAAQVQTSDKYTHSSKNYNVLNELQQLAGIRTQPPKGINISVSGTEKRELERKHNIQPGTPEFFKLWFSLPYMTGEKPVDKK